MIRKIWHYISSTMFVAVMISCATLSKNECLQADWFEIGRKDGGMGKPRALFQEHVEACQKHNVQADRIDYFRGRDEGLRFYCTRENGFEQGRKGRSYQHVCPRNLEPEFLAGYSKGRELQQYESKIASLERRLQSIENQIKTKEEQLFSAKLSDEERANIRTDIKYLDMEYAEAARELRYWQKRKPVD